MWLGYHMLGFQDVAINSGSSKWTWRQQKRIDFCRRSPRRPCLSWGRRWGRPYYEFECSRQRSQSSSSLDCISGEFAKQILKRHELYMGDKWHYGIMKPDAGHRWGDPTQVSVATPWLCGRLAVSENQAELCLKIILRKDLCVIGTLVYVRWRETISESWMCMTSQGIALSHINPVQMRK